MSAHDDFLVRPGSDGERIIRRENLRFHFQPAHVLGVLVVLIALVGLFFGPSIIDGVRTTQVTAHAESVVGMPLVVENKQMNYYSSIRITLVGTSTEFCDAVNEKDDDGYTKLQSYKSREGGCRVEVYESDPVWAVMHDMHEEPFSPTLLLRALFVFIVGAIGVIILSGERKFSPAQIVAKNRDDLAETDSLNRYVIGDDIDDQTIWDAIVKEREAASLEKFSDAVDAAVAVTPKQRIDGTAASTKSKRLRAEVATMLSGEN